MLDDGDDQKIKLARGLMDSGATQTCISNRIVEALVLYPCGRRRIRSVAGLVNAYEYEVEVIPPFADQRTYRMLKDIPVLGFPGGIEFFDVIIGRDILSLGIFQINGPAATFSFTI